MSRQRKCEWKRGEKEKKEKSRGKCWENKRKRSKLYEWEMLLKEMKHSDGHENRGKFKMDSFSLLDR